MILPMKGHGTTRPDTREGAVKVGLALSGGGFRAAFFHVGVLARMAELDLLRHVTILSCVSGGSLTGALYYLAVLKQRDGSPFNELTQSQYIECVKSVKKALAMAARGNVRGRVLGNFAKNLSMFLSPRYSRTDRAGDLLDSLLCREIYETERRYKVLRKQVELQAIERAWMPRLVFNATTLNTGHNWRFHTTGMGEQVEEDEARKEIDRNDRLEWTAFSAIPEDQRDFPLGLAVAASAAFPVMFRPLPIDGLYPGFRVDLMDGGAQDNQGVQAVFDEAKKNGLHLLIVSDGSAQLSDQRRARRGIPSVVMRVIGVEGDRIREEQLIGALDRASPACEVLHLRHGLLPKTIRPTGQATLETELAGAAIDARVQEALAHVRTDLDAFGDLESEMLIGDGYLIAADCLPPADGSNVGSWVSERVKAELTTQSSRRTRERLKAGSATVGKPWNLFGLTETVYVLLITLLGAAGWYLWRYFPSDRWTAAGLALAVFALPAVITRGGYWAFRRGRPGLVSRAHAKWLWAVTGAIYVAIVALVLCLESYLLDWLDVDWPTWKTLAITLSLLALPAVAPFGLSVLFLTEGRIWRALNRIPSS